jgi:IS605 OrfB family transposase
MKTTLQVKLLPSSEQHQALMDTMLAFNDACTWIAAYAFGERMFSKFALQKAIYYEVRARFNLSAQLAIRAIAKVVEAYKRDKKVCISFQPHGAVVYDERILSFQGLELASLTTLSGRVLVPIQMGDYQRVQFHRGKGQADLVLREGQFYLLVTIETPEEPPIDSERFIGVDLGIVNLATDSDGNTYTGDAVESNRKRRHTARQTYQSTGTKSAKRRLKQMSGKQSRFQRWANHRIAKRLVQYAKDTKAAIVLEDLTHIRARMTVRKRQRARQHNWSFGQLRQFISYKAQKAGVPVMLVDPRNTSRTCSRCGFVSKRNRKSQAEFSCIRCGHQAHADINAARNLVVRGEVMRPDLIAPASGQLTLAWQ